MTLRKDSISELSVQRTHSTESDAIQSESFDKDQIRESTTRDVEAVPEENKEIYKQAWTKNLLIISYAVLIFTAFVENFSAQSTSGLDSYATSLFNAHSLIATASVVYKITAIVSYPILGKLADFLGRSEGFGISVLIYTLAYVLYAACKNVETYVCAEILYAIGRVGYRVFQQIFIAQTTSLINRGLWLQLPDAVAAVPALYVGTVLQDAFIDHLTWRYGYGIWAICLAATSIPLTMTMYFLDRRAKQTGEQKLLAIMKNVPKGKWYVRAFHLIFREIDAFGGCLFIVGLSLLFVPLTLTGKSTSYKWSDPKLIAMLCVGVCLLIGFLIWNSRHISALLKKQSFVEPQSLTNPTIAVSCLMLTLDLVGNSSLATYFKTSLQVSGYYSVGEAARIDDAKKATVRIFSVVVGILMKYTKMSKIYVLIGTPMTVLAQGLLAYFINRNGGVASEALLYTAEVFMGFGRGFYQSGLIVIMQGVAGTDNIPMSTAFFMAFQSVGALIGSCISGGVWNSMVLHKLNRYLPESERSKAQKIYKSITVALSYERGTPERDAIAKLYRETVQVIGWIGLGVMGPMVILMFFVKNVKLTTHSDIYAEEEEEGIVIDTDEKNRERTTEIQVDNASSDLQSNVSKRNNQKVSSVQLP